MYGMVLMVAVTGSGDTASFGKKKETGCQGVVVVTATPCTTCAAPAPVVYAAPCTTCAAPAPAKKGLFGCCKKKEPAPAPCVTCAAPAPCHTCATPAPAPCHTCATPSCATPVFSTHGYPAVTGCALPPTGPPIVITPVVPMPMNPMPPITDPKKM